MTPRTLAWTDLFEAMPRPALLLDDAFRVVAANARFQREFGHEADTLRGASATDLLVLDEPDALRSVQLRLRAMPHDRGLAFGAGVRAAGGRIEARQAHACPVSGGSSRLVLVQFEPTPRRAAPARPDGADWHRALFEASPLPKLLLDSGHRIVDANDAALALTGFTLDQIIGQDPATLVEPDSRAQVLAARMARARRSNDGPEPVDAGAAGLPTGLALPRYRLRTRLGALRAVNALVQPAHDPTGSAVEVVTLLDDTEMLTHRQQIEDALREQRFLLETIAVGVALVVDGRIVHASGPFGRCLGMPAPALVGRSAETLLGTAAWQQLQAAAADSDPVEPHGRVHAGLLGADGAWRELVLCARGAARPAGPPGVVVSAFDVTRRAPDDSQRLAVLERQRDALVRQVHHHVKNGLFGVVGMLQAQALDEPAMARALAVVAGRLAAIAELHGLEARDPGEAGASLDLLLRSVLSGTERVYGCRIELHEAPGSSSCERLVSERARVPLTLLLHELLANAVKHRDPPDSPVMVRLWSDGQCARLRIENRGRPSEPVAPDLAQRRYAGLALVGMMAPRPGTDVSVRCEEGCWHADVVLVPPVLE